MTAVRPLRRLLAAAVAAAMTASAGGGSQAQVVAADNNAPVDITANDLDLIDAERVQIWRGAVEAVQGTNRLRTNVLRVYHEPKPAGSDLGDWGEAQRMVAEGDVYFITPDSVARGARGNYDLIRDVVTVTGDVIVTRGGNVLRGDRLTIDVATGRSTMESDTPGRGNQRVRGVFYPESGSAPAGAPPAPAG